MIEKEKAYLKGEFTPFEESTQSDGTDIKKKRSKNTMHIIIYITCRNEEWRC